MKIVPNTKVNVLTMLTAIPLFKGLPEGQLHDISRIALLRKLSRGETIFVEGDNADGFYIVLSGRIKIFKLSSEGKEQILHIFASGEPFGEVPMFLGEKFPAYATTLEESSILYIPKKTFIELIRRDPSLAMNMLALLSIRLKHFTRLVEDLSLKEVPQRLAAYLLYLTNPKNKTEDIELDISKGQLASLIGTIPETLSRILNKMAAHNLIEVRGRKIRLLHKEAMEHIASGVTTLT